MKTYTIDTENAIAAFATAEEAAAASTTPFDSFSTRQELADLITAWPPERIVATWNSLPGVAPVKRFKTSNAAATKIWERIQRLGEAAQPESEEAKPAARSAKGKAAGKAKAGAKAAKGAPAKGKPGKKSTPAKAAPKGKKAAKPAESDGPREGSKMSQVIEMMRRKNGATIEEIMESMGWQRHTVRGFVAGVGSSYRISASIRPAWACRNAFRSNSRATQSGFPAECLPRSLSRATSNTAPEVIRKPRSAVTRGPIGATRSPSCPAFK